MRELSRASFIRVLIPFITAPPHDLIISQRRHLLIPWGLGFQRILGEYIQNIADGKPMENFQQRSHNLTSVLGASLQLLTENRLVAGQEGRGQGSSQKFSTFPWRTGCSLTPQAHARRKGQFSIPCLSSKQNPHFLWGTYSMWVRCC